MNKFLPARASAPSVIRYSDQNASPVQSNTKYVAGNIDRWLVRKLLEIIGNPPVIFILWNSEEIVGNGNKIVGRINIHDRLALYRLLVHPEFHFGDLYSEGRIVVEGNLPEILSCIYRSIGATNKNPISRLLALRFKRRSRRYDRLLSKKNIHHHYDIGNEFYKKWLDNNYMQYTCAYFSDPLCTLEQAQVAKMEHICRKLSLKPGQVVVEAGCGWGGLSRYMAQKYGVKVKAYNISHEQIDFAREMSRKENLQDQIEYIEDDYQAVNGDYDAFVSVGMLEHIGVENYLAMGSVIDRCLKENGKGLIHSIGRNSPQQLNDWIERRIFPGACPPSISQMMIIFESQSFSVLDIENLRLHYAKTLQHWSQRFERNADTIANDFDENFVRSWRLYLAGSIAGFTSGTMQLFQVLFSRSQNNELPNTRAYLYR